MKLEDAINQKKFKSEFHKGFLNIIFTSKWIEGIQKDFFTEFDLTPQQYNVMRILRGQYPEAMTVSFIKERMIDKMCDASRMVDRLKSKGYIDKKTSKKDRRAASVVINEAGLSLLEKIDVKVHKIEDCLQNLSEEEVKTLNNLLDKIRD